MRPFLLVLRTISLFCYKTSIDISFFSNFLACMTHIWSEIFSANQHRARFSSFPFFSPLPFPCPSIPSSFSSLFSLFPHFFHLFPPLYTIPSPSIPFFSILLPSLSSLIFPFQLSNKTKGRRMKKVYENFDGKCM